MSPALLWKLSVAQSNLFKKSLPSARLRGDFLPPAGLCGDSLHSENLTAFLSLSSTGLRRRLATALNSSVDYIFSAVSWSMEQFLPALSSYMRRLTAFDFSMETLRGSIESI